MDNIIKIKDENKFLKLKDNIKKDFVTDMINKNIVKLLFLMIQLLMDKKLVLYVIVN